MYQALNPFIEIQNNVLYLKFDFDQELIKIVGKQGLGMDWSRAHLHWYARCTKIFIQKFLEIFPHFKPELKEYVQILPLPHLIPSNYLMEHQRLAVLKALDVPRYCFFHDIGTGKTVLQIDLIKQKRVKTLVVCPLSIIETAWMEDISTFAQELLPVNLWKARKQKGLQAVIKAFDLCIINFESFKAEAEKLAEAGFQMLLVDESAKLKNARSDTSEKIKEFAENMDYVYEFSGCPAPNNEMEYFSQAQLVDPTLFGSSFYAFRNKYFYSHGYGNFRWSMKEEMRDEFMEKLKTISEVVRKEDVLDLPERTYNIRKVYLDTSERKMYEEMKRHLVIEFGGKEVIAANAGVKLMKLREGTSGFYLDDDSNVVHVGNSKLKELQELLEEIGDHQAIIWTHFHHEADMVEKMLFERDKGLWGRVDGTIANQNVKDEYVRAFKDQRIQYLIAHPLSLGHGVTLVNCTHAVYFSLSHSYEQFDQSAGRIYRKGQKNKCSYFFLIADCSVDEVIYQALKHKGKVVDAVFRYIRGGK